MATGGGAHWNPQSQRWEWADQPPPPPPPPPPFPPGSGGGGGGGPVRDPRGKVPLLVALGAVVVGGCALAGWFVLDDEEPRTPAAAPSASGAPHPPSGTGPNAEPVSPSASASTSPSTPPPYAVVRDDAGFSVAVPSGWERSHDEDGQGSFYRRPGDRSALVQIFRVTEPDSVGACELLRISSQALGVRSGYREVSVDPVPGASCELVYEYDSEESGGRRRGIERIAVAPDGGRWALLAAGPAADGTAVRANLTAAVESFRPD
ncbi:hypothetical protein ACGFZK_19690 [Streptomyces sp. NPDC048257]|uniref:hypothetical protein n=1 Tax=Streptomyces sp. NPDC048257 TaxID=3365526 RepID=UPI0037199AFB